MLILSAVVPEPSDACRAALKQVAIGITPELPTIAGRMAVIIHDADPQLTEDLLPETEGMCLANIVLVVDMMGSGRPPEGVTAPTEALEYSERFVHRGLTVDALLTVYRVGHGAFWQMWLEHMRRHVEEAEALTEAIAYCSAWTFAYVDAVSGPIATAYVAEKGRWARSAAAQRVDEVTSILAGKLVDEQRTSQRLRYDLGRRHIGYVVWTDTPGEDSTTDAALEELTVRIGRAIGCTSPLVTSVEPGTISGWASAPPGEFDALALTSQLTGDIHRHHALVAFGNCAEGLAGFRSTYHNAHVARRVAQLAARRPGARVRFDDVALVALLTNDLPEARRYVVQELGRLAEDTDAMRRLVVTLRVYLEEGASPVRAARRLSVHENTVIYRVKRASELLGRPVDDDALRLHVALSLSEVLRVTDEADT